MKKYDLRKRVSSQARKQLDRIIYTQEEAEDLKWKWCHYHSFYADDFSVEETTDEKWLHNEYIW